jgi:hypothetical protein
MLEISRASMMASDFIHSVFTTEPGQVGWHKKPLGVLCLYLFLCWLIYWQIHIPSPGKAGTVLAVAAAAMSLRGEMQGKGKVAWIFLLFGFLSLELTSITTERYSNEELRAATQAEEARSFGKIGDGLKTSIKENEDNFRTMFGLASSQNDNLVQLLKRRFGSVVMPSYGNLKERALLLSHEILTKLIEYETKPTNPNISYMQREREQSNVLRHFFLGRVTSLRDELAKFNFKDDRLDHILDQIQGMDQMSKDAPTPYISTVSEYDWKQIAERLTALAEQVKR